MSELLVEVRRENALAHITLNRPAKLNSFTRDLHRQLREAIDLAQEDAATRVIILSGAGRAFSAGQDLADITRDDGSTDDLEPLIQDFFNPLIMQIRRCPKPIVAKVRGIAAGAGANLAFACDFVIAGRSANFLQAFVNIGLLPDSGGTWFLPHLIGPARARGLAMLGEKLSAETAHQWGLIWALSEDDQLDSDTMNLANRLAALPPKALAACKLAIDAASTQNLERSLDLELRLQADLGSSADYREGVSAFLQKRKANFTGS
jgi:2-(1,2-epoxy-1,2-dihydrophenyl)acetyl-CoA isomerase